MKDVKIRVGATASTKIMLRQYEPIEVSSMIEIEREIPEDKADEYVKEEQEKLTQYVIDDARKKIKAAATAFNIKREKLLGDLN